MLWKYKSIANLPFIEALVLRDEIYFSSPPELNDPSETRFHFRFDYSINYEDLENNFRRLQPNATDAELVELVAQLVDGRAFQGLEKSLREALFDQFRLFCLTKTATNPLMWAHYADNHAGLCVGIDMDRLLASCHVAVHGEVRYQDEPFSLKFDGKDDLDALLWRLAGALFTKDRRWSYEQEVRLATFKEPAIQCAPEAVRSVVLGLRASAQTRALVMRWKDMRPHLDILEARQAGSFELALCKVT